MLNLDISDSKLLDFELLDCSKLFLQRPGLPGGLEFVQKQITNSVKDGFICVKNEINEQCSKCQNKNIVAMSKTIKKLNKKINLVKTTILIVF
jgi:hypothetical protein